MCGRWMDLRLVHWVAGSSSSEGGAAQHGRLSWSASHQQTTWMTRSPRTRDIGK